MFCDYRLLNKPQTEMPQIKVGKMYEYVLAADGVYLHAKREGLEVFLPVMEPLRYGAEVRGLLPATPFVKMDYPKVPHSLVEQMLESAIASADDRGRPLEVLFHLIWTGRPPGYPGWKLVLPEQKRHYASVNPIGSSLAPGGSYELAFIECHSHHHMNAFFSGTDDRDEQGFRIYAVLGKIYDHPQLRVRVGVFGQHFQIPATEIFELPYEGRVRDAIVADELEQETSPEPEEFELEAMEVEV
jgi:PRTRC genetic system protein A